MKRTLILGGLAALTLGGAGAALAQQDPGRGMRADQDADGRISRAEFVGARVERLSALDANGDGSVTPEEMQAGRQARREQGADQRFTRLDADGNGAVTRAEFDAAREARPERAERAGRGGHRRMHGMGGMRGRHGGEGRERGPVSVAEAQTRSGQAFDRLDANSDGYLTAEERQARRAMRHERRSRPAAASE
jgi:Ca2+-binding EF-hand superfamily protein